MMRVPWMVVLIGMWLRNISAFTLRNPSILPLRRSHTSQFLSKQKHSSMKMVSPHSQSNEIFHLALPLVWMSALPSVLHLLHPKVAHAAGKEIALKGWGLYGRVPYDDFLFTNDKLLDPNFLRKSFVESVWVRCF